MHINFAFSFPTTMKQVNTKDDMVPFVSDSQGQRSPNTTSFER